MTKRRLNLAQAEEIAREAFLRHYAGRHIPDAIRRRLGHSIGPKGNEWVVSIVLHSEDPSLDTLGLAGDLLEPLPESLIRIHVDRETGEARLIECRPVPW